MTAARKAADSMVPQQPAYPLRHLTISELRGYRRQLEQAITYFDARDPVPPVWGDLQARLDAVIAEQDERARIAADA